MILASQSGMMIACRLVKESDKAWTVNYNDKAYPKNVRVPKSGNRQVFKSVDDALDWMNGDE
jgi:hypothetical protein